VGFVFDIFDMLKTYEPPEIPLELLHSQNCLTKCLGFEPETIEIFTSSCFTGLPLKCC
jgi:hypothetical protein